MIKYAAQVQHLTITSSSSSSYTLRYQPEQSTWGCWHFHSVYPLMCQVLANKIFSSQHLLENFQYMHRHIELCCTVFVKPVAPHLISSAMCNVSPISFCIICNMSWIYICRLSLRILLSSLFSAFHLIISVMVVSFQFWWSHSYGLAA